MIEFIGDVPVEAAEEKASEERDFFATIGNYNSNGITLIFDGSSTASQKRYKCNKGIDANKWVAGTRVKCLRISGTIIVEYPI